MSKEDEEVSVSFMWRNSLDVQRSVMRWTTDWLRLCGSGLEERLVKVTLWWEIATDHLI